MTEFTDFTSGLQSVNDYLDAKHHLSGTTAIGSDSLNVVAAANYSFSLREIICSMLGGHGFKLPNIQICLYANLNALLGLDQLQAALRTALTGLAEAFSKFMDSLSIDSVLGRLNSIISEAINVANMINFCGSPIDPIAIPNMLEQAFSSLLGKGDEIISKIGFPTISTCLSFDESGNSTFNVDGFINDSGIFGDIARNYTAVSGGTLTTTEVNSLVNDINGISQELEELVAAENNIKGAYDFGGSDFPDTSVDGSGGSDGLEECSTDLGILHNPSSGNMASNTRIASSLRSVYSQLGAYPVQYVNQTTGEVTEYNNIFELFVTPAVLELLRQYEDDDSVVTTQVPVVDYCGNIIGYTTTTVQGDPDQVSNGNTPSSVTCPGDSSNYSLSDPNSELIYPRTTPQVSSSDSTIVDTVSKTSGSVDQETGFETSSDDITNTSNSAKDSRKISGDNWFYTNELEEYNNSSGNIIINLERRERGNYISKHVATIDKNTTLYFNDHNRKLRESGYFELMLEHISGILIFDSSTNIIWDGGDAPTLDEGNFHVFEFRNFGGNDWSVTANNSNYWLGKIVGSFPIPTS